jgi:hypothetical protein
MTNLYQEVSTNYSGSEDKRFGSIYIKNKLIKTPSEIETNSKDSASKDINDLIQYVETLLSGKSNALSANKYLEKDVDSFTLLSSTAPQQKISMSALPSDNDFSSETHYVPMSDISSLDSSRENFQNIDEGFLLPDDPVAQLYLASLGIVGLFILYRLMEKSK